MSCNVFCFVFSKKAYWNLSKVTSIDGETSHTPHFYEHILLRGSKKEKYCLKKLETCCSLCWFEWSIWKWFWPTLCSCLAMLSNESDSRKFLAPTKRRPLSSSNSRALKQQDRSSSNRRTPWNCCNSEYKMFFRAWDLSMFSYMRDTLYWLNPTV